MKITASQETAILNLIAIFNDTFNKTASQPDDERYMEYGRKGVTAKTIKGLEKLGIVEITSYFQHGYVDVKKGKNWNLIYEVEWRNYDNPDLTNIIGTA